MIDATNHALRYIDGIPRPLAFQTADDALSWAEKAGARVRVHYGYATPAARDQARTDAPAVGQDWGDVYDVTGRISRSMGTPGRPETRIRIMVANARAMGGSPILSPDCIVRVRYANRGGGGGDLYRHPDYLPPARADAFPDDLERSRRDYARNFGADYGDPRGQTIDRLTLSLQDAGRSYTLHVGAFDAELPDPSTCVGIIDDTGRPLAIVALDGSAVRYWGDGTPEHVNPDGSTPVLP